ncbi:Dabb family protein [Telluribacter sp. SYSU D00476]|uniref:Dabb family protein n=1 Tax=Telluribacter sp. SYSU D00476 TaxID=2811430 RepID=UPI001FF12202|nr:Dabb family protein [Telluribacter sp. SYSU D00476]
MFVHTVYFWLKEKGNEQAHQDLLAGIQTLESIDAIHASYIGVPAETRRPVIDHTYDFSITFVFTDKAAHDIYQEHPTHLKFVDNCKHLWERVQVYDAVNP